MDFSGFPGKIVYFKFPVARPAATGGLYTPKRVLFVSSIFKNNPEVSPGAPRR